MQFQGGSRWEKNGLQVVFLQGSPEELGRQHGLLLKHEIRRCYYELIEERIIPGLAHEIYGGNERKMKQFDLWFREQTKKYAPNVRPEFEREMRAMSNEVGLTYHQILRMQVVLDIAELAGLVHSKDFFHNCTQAAFLPEFTGGSTIFARNLDWPPFGVINEMLFVFHVVPEDGIPFCSLGFAGLIGALTAMNAETLAISEESLTETEDAGDEGQPHFLMHRELIQLESSVEGAVQRLIGQKRNNGYHTLIASGKEEKAAVVEYSANHHGIRDAKAGVIMGVETNRKAENYRGGQWPDENVPLTDETSDFRYGRLKELSEVCRGKTTPKDAMDWLSDSIDIETGEETSDLHALANETTLQSFVADLTKGRMWVAMGELPAPKGGFVPLQAEEMDCEYWGE